MNLLIDIGNSRLKWLLEDDGQFADLHALDYRQPDFLVTLQQAWQVIDSPTNIAIAAVANRQIADSVEQLCLSLWQQPNILIPQAKAEAFGLKNAYAQPEKLGVDRWLALIAAHHHYPGDTCIVDCGTAITIDVIQADGSHLGGLICPGLTLMKQALVSNTADLGFSNQAFAAQLGTKTEAGIANGVFMAAIGLIEQTMQKLTAHYQLLLTGGDAQTVAQGLNRVSKVDEGLVLKGLSLCCRGASAS